MCPLHSLIEHIITAPRPQSAPPNRSMASTREAPVARSLAGASISHNIGSVALSAPATSESVFPILQCSQQQRPGCGSCLTDYLMLTVVVLAEFPLTVTLMLTVPAPTKLRGSRIAT